MKRTRKWAFVAQEAGRLADLGLAPTDIARRLDVEVSTVTRWMKAGKLRDTRKAAKAGLTPSVNVSTKPSDWASTVRKQYALDATDDQLVTLAEAALGKALDAEQPVSVQLQAMQAFRGLVKDLSLVAKQADQGAGSGGSQPVGPRRTLPVRPAGDPRAILSAVK